MSKFGKPTFRSFITLTLLRDELLEQRGRVLVATTGGSTKIVKWMLDSLVLLHKVLR